MKVIRKVMWTFDIFNELSVFKTFRKPSSDEKIKLNHDRDHLYLVCGFSKEMNYYIYGLLNNAFMSNGLNTRHISANYISK